MLIVITLSLVLYFLSFLPAGLWPLAWISFIPVLYFAFNPKYSLYELFRSSFVSFFIIFMVFYYWVYNFLPAGLLFVVLLLTLYYSTWILFTAYLARKLPSLRIPITAASFILTEGIRSTSEISLNWCLLGHSQVNNPLILQSASFFGEWWIGLIIIFFNAAIADYFFSKKNRQTAFFSIYRITSITLVVLSLIYGILYQNTAKSDITNKTISLIQTSFKTGSWKKDPVKYTKQVLFLAKTAAKLNSSLIIFPETVFPIPLKKIIENRNKLTKKENTLHRLIIEIFAVSKKYNKKIIMTFPIRSGKNIYNSAVLLEPDLPAGKWMQRYDKLKPAAFGEYLPYKKILSFLRPLIPSLRNMEITKGKNYTVFNTKNMKFSILICYEDMFGNISSRFRRDGAEFLLVITNDAGFDSSQARYQHLIGSIFTAVQNGCPVYRSANTGITAFIDKFGSVKKSLHEEKNGILTIPVYTDKKLTFYIRHGHRFRELILLISLFFLTICVLSAMRKPKINQNKS